MASKRQMLAKIREFIVMMENTPRSTVAKTASVQELYDRAKRGEPLAESVEMVTVKASSFELLIRLAYKGLVTLENEE